MKWTSKSSDGSIATLKTGSKIRVITPQRDHPKEAPQGTSRGGRLVRWAGGVLGGLPMGAARCSSRGGGSDGGRWAGGGAVPVGGGALLFLFPRANQRSGSWHAQLVQYRALCHSERKHICV